MEEMLKSGLVVVGSKGCGKSNAVKEIISQILTGKALTEKIARCKIYDTCQNWRHEFERIPFFEVDEYIHVDDYLIQGENNDVILYDFELSNVDDIMHLVGESIKRDFATNREMKKRGSGSIPYWDIYCIEEAQNVLGSYSLNKDTGKFWLKAISEGRNFNMAFIFIGQRLADISTKAIERAQGYLFGKITGDNDKNKIRRICGKIITVDNNHDVDIRAKISSLKQGQFIYWNGVQGWTIDFNLYKSNTKPYQINGGMIS